MRNTLATKLLFEMSKSGRRSNMPPACDVPQQPISEYLPATVIADQPPALPELCESDIVRHYLNLSTLNMSVDTHFYPLGSCTMKYNPKRNERVANMPGLVDLHPYQPEETIQGILEMLYDMQLIFAEIAGLDAVSLQPAAGAHGELTALMVAQAYFRHRSEKRTKVLAPDSAHGTNPASASMVGFEAVTVKSNSNGFVDLEDLKSKINSDTAVFMITNPNTLGLFEPQIKEIADLVHSHGALMYLDGANMNAILGIARPGDFGADMMHYNPHKTFSGPHGGGGPGAGPIAVRKMLEPFLPSPMVVKNGDRYSLNFERPLSIGRVRSFFGQVGVYLRAYSYIRSYGPEGLKKVSQHAVLNANYLLSKVKHFLPVPHGERCLHEFVATASKVKAEKGFSAMDIAKRLLDYGFHAPTVYFPLTVREAIMIEPTETESKETLDAFAEVLFRVLEESPAQLQSAPHSTAISRPDEVTAARKPAMRWEDVGTALR
jgi:glycine dehydrogenase subunit 2